MKSTHQLLQDGKVLFEGTENECYYCLQRIQGRSADWAMKYEGYAIVLKVTEVMAIATVGLFRNGIKN